MDITFSNKLEILYDKMKGDLLCLAAVAIGKEVGA